MTVIPEGVYSETLVQRIGTMSTARRQEVINYYSCRQLDGEIVEVQILDIYGEPLPLREKVPLGDFLKRFKHEPDKFKTKKTTSDLAVDKAIVQAELHVKRKEYFSAEYEYSKALKLDEANVRANFGLGRVYLKVGEPEKAGEIFTRLAKEESTLDSENKHIFNELGMELRSLKLYDQALEFYERAMEVAPDDENLCFNIARAAAEKGDLDLAGESLNRALKIKPGMESALNLLAQISPGRLRQKP